MHRFFVDYLIGADQMRAVGYGAFVEFYFRLLHLNWAAGRCDSPFSVVTGCGLDGQEFWVRFPPRTEICHWLCRPSSLLYNGYTGLFPRR